MELVVNNDEQMKAGTTPPVKSGRVNAADFDSAELRAGPTMGQGLYLIVSGPMPKPGANIRLLPILGNPPPEYQRIELAWEARAANDHGASMGVERYEKSMPLSGLLGTKGIELVGANGTKKFNLTGH